MTPSQRQQDIDSVRSEIRRLRFAVSDMGQAAAAATALAADESQNGDLRRALETAIAVCYARPFGGNRGGVGPLEDEWVPREPDAQSLHSVLLRLRDQVHAHSDGDAIGGREIIDVWKLFTEEEVSSIAHFPRFTEQWYPIPVEALPAIIELALAQRKRFDEGVAEATGKLTALERRQAAG